MRLTVARKLWLAFAVVLVLLVAVAALAVWNLSSARVAVADLIELRGVAESLDRSTEYLLLERARLSQYVTTGDNRYSVDAKAARGAHWGAWLPVLHHRDVRDLAQVQDMQDAAFTYHSLLQSALDTYEDNPDEIMAALLELNRADEFFTDILAPVRNELVGILRGEVEAAEISVDQLLATMRVAAVTGGVAAFVVAVVSAYVISRGITRAAAHLAAAAESISRGELDVAIEVRTGDEMQDLAESIDRMRASLKAAVDRLRRHRTAG